MCPSPFVRTKRPPHARGNLEIIIKKKKKISSQVAASLFVDRIIFKDPAPIRDDGVDRRKKGEMRNAFAFFFLSP